MALAEKLRSGAPTVGYWMLTHNPVAAERIGLAGYDYVCFDAQHGQLDFGELRDGIVAVDAAGVASLVRVQENQQWLISQVLDAGATGVIVPMVNTAEEAAAAVAACRYPPHGKRSYGPIRAGLRLPTTPAETDEAVLCLPMIETAEGLANIEEIAAVQGVDGLYIGPFDLRITLGGAGPLDPAYDDAMTDALARVRAACTAAGIAPGIHCPSGEVVAARLADGFTWASVASDLEHLEQVAKDHLATARG